MPRGLLFWCQELELDDEQIDCSLRFPSSCTPNIFQRVFQYKITTNILPTQEYLFRYQVTDSNTCQRCKVETDFVLHRLYECEKITPLIKRLENFLNHDCGIHVDLDLIPYIFGFTTNESYTDGLNHCILEFKIYTFYSYKENLTTEGMFGIFLNILERLVIKEKQIALTKNKLENFTQKWSDFRMGLYDFMGPDPLII